MGTDGKAEVVDQKKLEQCGGEKVCPFGAIERVGEGKENESDASFQQPTSSYKSPFGGRGMGRGSRGGRGRGRGGGRKKTVRIKLAQGS